MAIEHLLRDLIKPELNGIYTEPPSALRGGGDMGLFCREHAFHCLALCGMLRLRAAIVRGDFTAILDEKTGVTSFGDHSDHAWCQIEDVCPVDLSANFDFYGTGLPSLDLVYGVGRRGPYLISCTDDTELYQRRMDDRGHLPRLSYLERETVRIPLDDMLIDPHVLLTKPPRGGLEEIFGKGCFNSINLHLHDLALGRTKRLTTYKDSKSAVRTIVARYRNATERVRKLVSDGGGGCEG